MEDDFNQQSFRRTRWIMITAALVLIVMTGSAAISAVQNNPVRSPSDVVREFYKAMRERRFKDAWALTIYKTAVEGLTPEEMEDLRPDFEDRAAKIPEQVEIVNEQITGNIAVVFVKVPNEADASQTTSEPVTLISSRGQWIIGTEADQAEVVKKGRRFFLDAMIDSHQTTIIELLKRLITVEIGFASTHNGAYGNLDSLISAGLMSHDVSDTAANGYTFHINIEKDGKGYTAGAEPVRYGHTGKLSFWMDQTGTIKSADNKGKPLSGK
jgi:hypothetical protein